MWGREVNTGRGRQVRVWGRYTRGSGARGCGGVGRPGGGGGGRRPCGHRWRMRKPVKTQQPCGFAAMCDVRCDPACGALPGVWGEDWPGLAVCSASRAKPLVFSAGLRVIDHKVNDWRGLFPFPINDLRHCRASQTTPFWCHSSLTGSPYGEVEEYGLAGGLRFPA